MPTRTIIIGRNVYQRIDRYIRYITATRDNYRVSRTRALEKELEIYNALKTNLGNPHVKFKKTRFKQMGSDKGYHEFIHKMKGTNTTFVFAVTYDEETVLVHKLENSALIKEGFKSLSQYIFELYQNDNMKSLTQYIKESYVKFEDLLKEAKKTTFKRRKT